MIIEKGFGNLEMKKIKFIDFAIISTSILLLMLNMTTQSYIYKILLFSTLWIMSLVYSKMEVVNPMFWYSTVFYIYGIANSLFKVLFLNISLSNKFSDIDLSLIAYVVFLIAYIVIDFLGKNIKPKKHIPQLNISNRGSKFILLINVVLLILVINYIRLTGLSTKLELINHGFILQFYSNLFMSYYVLTTIYFINKELNNKLVFIDFFILILLNFYFYLYTGERDIVIFPIVTIMMIFSYRKFKYLSPLKFILILILGITSLPLLLNIGVRSSGGNGFFNFQNFFYRLFSTELISASKNLELITNDVFFEPIGIVVPISILINSIINIPLMPRLIDFSGVAFFNMRYYSDGPQGAGLGYTIVGEGYIFSGIIGVVIWFVLLALFIYILYQYSSKSLFLRVLYCSMIPVIMYSVRGGFESIISILSRYIFFYLLFWVVDELIWKKQIDNTI